MQLAFLLLATLALSLPCYGWEELTTRSGTTIEGDITQEEFLLNDPAGGEIVIPRAAIDRLEADGESMTATLKDGTTVAGGLKGTVQIEDGLIKRRYAGSDIERVVFDNYIDIQHGTQYHSCPIRLSLPAGEVLLSETSAHSTALTGAVTCGDLKIANIAFSRQGKLAAGRDASVTARFSVSVPSGSDQRANVLLEFVQADNVVARARKELTLDEDETNLVTLKLTVPADRFEENGPEPRFRVQLVNQDEDREVERGGFFWWFTVPIPL